MIEIGDDIPPNPGVPMHRGKATFERGPFQGMIGAWWFIGFVVLMVGMFTFLIVHSIWFNKPESDYSFSCRGTTGVYSSNYDGSISTVPNDPECIK